MTPTSRTHATDPLGHLGIAVVAADAPGGHWEFSRDGGTNWSGFNAVSTASAELLPGDAQVRFVPDPDWNGQAGGLAFVAWDLSGGTAGNTRADARTSGGTSPFSSGTATASITVEAVNDAPVPLEAPSALVIGVPTGAPVPLALDGVAYAPGGGADETAQSLTVTLTTLPPASVGTIVLADGHTPAVLGVGYSVTDLRSMQFVAAAGASGVVGTVAWTVRDNGGTAGGGVDHADGSVSIQVGLRAVDAAIGSVPVAPPGPLAIVAGTMPVAQVPAAPAATTPSSTAVAPGRVGGTVETSLGGALDGQQGGTVLSTVTGFAPQQLQLALDGGRAATAVELEQRNLALASLDVAGDFLVTGFSGLEGAVSRVSGEQFQQALRSGAFADELNRLRRQLHEEFDLDRTTTITVAGLSLGVSLVYVLWLIRGGVPLGSYVSALPAWRLLDPLPVLARAGEDEEDEDDEALPTVLPTAPDPLRGFA